jgi:hypothetical protein
VQLPASLHLPKAAALAIFVLAIAVTEPNHWQENALPGAQGSIASDAC